jgi:hypothetical protein
LGPRKSYEYPEELRLNDEGDVDVLGNGVDSQKYRRYGPKEPEIVEITQKM